MTGVRKPRPRRTRPALSEFSAVFLHRPYDFLFSVTVHNLATLRDRLQTLSVLFGLGLIVVSTSVLALASARSRSSIKMSSWNRYKTKTTAAALPRPRPKFGPNLLFSTIGSALVYFRCSNVRFSYFLNNFTEWTTGNYPSNPRIVSCTYTIQRFSNTSKRKNTNAANKFPIIHFQMNVTTDEKKKKKRKIRTIRRILFKFQLIVKKKKTLKM